MLNQGRRGKKITPLPYKVTVGGRHYFPRIFDEPRILYLSTFLTTVAVAHWCTANDPTGVPQEFQRSFINWGTLKHVNFPPAAGCTLSIVKKNKNGMP